MWDAVLEQTDGLGFLHARGFAQFGDDSFRNVAIHVHHGERFAGLARFGFCAPAKREIRDVDFVFAEDRAHAPDHARNIAIAHVDEIAFQWSFGFDAVDVQQARLVIKHRAFDYMLFAAGFQTQREHTVIVSRFFRLAFLGNSQPTGIGNGRGIHQVGFFFQALIQDALDRGIPNQLCLGFGDMARVTQRDFLQRAFAYLGDESAQPFSAF
jgi:hypothetical protein